jgi:Neu-associated kinase
VNSQCYTPHYAAPEIQNDKSYNVQVDIYALGATFYYMLFGRCPFTGNNITELDTSKNKGDVAFDMTKTAISKASVDFICQCLKLIAYRPHLADLLEHPTINTRYEILAKDSFPKGEIKWINVHAYATIYS